MHSINIDLLHYCIVLYIVKKKTPIHPRLYINISIDGPNVLLKYYSNELNNKNQRIIKQDINNREDNVNYNILFLYEKNKIEYQNLTKFIKIQKKALEKHEKSGNYDSCRVVKSSILLMIEFKSSFNQWFNENNFKI